MLIRQSTYPSISWCLREPRTLRIRFLSRSTCINFNLFQAIWYPIEKTTHYQVYQERCKNLDVHWSQFLNDWRQRKDVFAVTWWENVSISVLEQLLQEIQIWMLTKSGINRPYQNEIGCSGRWTVWEFLNKVGIPRSIASNLTYPEIVTPFNVDYLQHLGFGHYFLKLRTYHISTSCGFTIIPNYSEWGPGHSVCLKDFRKHFSIQIMVT